MEKRLLSYPETEGLLGRYGLPLAQARLVRDSQAAAQAAQQLGLPVALKIVSPAQSHKSDAGLVVLGLDSPERVSAAASRLLEHASGLPLEGLLVQRMAPPGVEALVGVTQDPQFGPVLACGPGGVLVELLDEASLRMPPLTPWLAGGMLAETRLGRLLEGYRGRPAADREALTTLLCNVARLAVDLGPRLVSLDLNPVIVLPAGQGACVVDARVYLAKEV